MARFSVFRALNPCARVLWFVTIAIALCSAGGPLVPCPEIEQSQKRLKLTPAIAQALSAAAPGFKALTLSDFSDGIRKSYPFTKLQAPWAVIGDFDGDGFCDLVIDGRSRTDSYRLCAWGSDQGPSVITLARRRLRHSVGGRNVALIRVSRQELYRRIDEKDAAESSGDAFGEGVSGRLTRIYYWRNGHFIQRDLM